MGSEKNKKMFEWAEILWEFTKFYLNKMLKISALYLQKQKVLFLKKTCCRLVFKTLICIVTRASARYYTVFSMVLKVAFIQRGLMFFHMPEPNYFTELRFCCCFSILNGSNQVKNSKCSKKQFNLRKNKTMSLVRYCYRNIF